jgi:hypothetical protein
LNEIGGRCGFPVLRSFNPQNGKGSRSILKPEESTLLVCRESQDLQKTLPARREREKKLSNATPNLHTKKMAESQMFGPSYNHGCMKDAEQKQGKSVY